MSCVTLYNLPEIDQAPLSQSVAHLYCLTGIDVCHSLIAIHVVVLSDLY